MATKSGEVKPLLRGQFHRAAFIAYLLAAALLVYQSKPGLPRISMGVYLATLLNLYGISSVLHITDWQRPHLEARVQRIDHASIFLLIAGTYTPLCLNCLPKSESWPLFMLISAWAIAVAGVIKCLVWSNLPKAFNVAFYFVCGLTIIPFAPQLLHHVSWTHLILLLAGGIMYLVGGVIYGTEYPDPMPLTFGFHEIFHILTILANICFLAPICSCVLA